MDCCPGEGAWWPGTEGRAVPLTTAKCVFSLGMWHQQGAAECSNRGRACLSSGVGWEQHMPFLHSASVTWGTV